MRSSEQKRSVEKHQLECLLSSYRFSQLLLHILPWLLEWFQPLFGIHFWNDSFLLPALSARRWGQHPSCQTTNAIDKSWHCWCRAPDKAPGKVCLLRLVLRMAIIWLSVKRDFFIEFPLGSDPEKILLMNTPVFMGRPGACLRNRSLVWQVLANYSLKTVQIPRFDIELMAKEVMNFISPRFC